jgi:glucose-6-phosphate isomerase
MNVDIGGTLASVASPGISRAALERLDEDVAVAHDRIERGRQDGEHGYAALNLPERVDLDAIRDVTERFDDVAAVLVVGIGGSALGAATLGEALDTDAALHVLDNVDPAATESLCTRLPLENTVTVAVSRSGTTAETLANVLLVRDAYDRAGVDWTDRTMVITGDSGPLAELGEREGLPRLPVPEGVPGRFAVLSTVGLAPAALAGVDVEGLLAGSREQAARLDGSLFDCPPYAYGAVAHALEARGATSNAMMPYAESLERYAEWFAQLWAESLGKDGLGQLPQRTLGVTDQHSQLQYYRAGRRSTMLTVVRPRDRPDVTISTPEHEDLAYLQGTTLGELIDTEYEATAASMAAACRPAVRVEIERVDARALGRLLYGMEAACILSGELAGVDTFVQPAVEWGKRAARGLLRGDETPETEAVEDRTSLWIE